MKKIIVLSAFLAAWISCYSQNYSLTVLVKDVVNTKGEMYIGLFTDPNTFPEKGDEEIGIILPAKNDSMSYTFRDIPSGKYAVAVYHDENLDGVLTKNMFGVPKEYYGFSNNARGSFGPPKFEEAAFSLNADKTIEINLK